VSGPPMRPPRFSHNRVSRSSMSTLRSADRDPDADDRDGQDLDRQGSVSRVKKSGGELSPARQVSRTA
jgi:hypothetical protein